MPKEVLSILNANNDVDFILKLSIWFLAILVPLYDVVGALVLLIAIDLLTGIVSALKVKAKFQWSKILNTLTKTFVYSIVLIASWVVESKIIPAIPFMRLTAGFLALNELRSIYYNFKQIFGLDIWDYIRSIIKRQGLQDIPDKKR